jgi:hypothetical protein
MPIAKAQRSGPSAEQNRFGTGVSLALRLKSMQINQRFDSNEITLITDIYEFTMAASDFALAHKAAKWTQVIT